MEYEIRLKKQIAKIQKDIEALTLQREIINIRIKAKKKEMKKKSGALVKTYL